jgi:uncharacterized membrane protein
VGGPRIYPLFVAIAIVCYVAAVIIAFPLGAVLELVREDISLIPLSIGAFAMSIAMLLETRTS